MSRPNPDVYKLPNLEVDFNFRKLIASIVAISIFLLLPIIAIESISNYKPTTNNVTSVAEPQVAGISTTSSQAESSYIILFNQRFDLNTQAGLLAILGLIFLGIALILIIYLIADSLIRNKSN